MYLICRCARNGASMAKIKRVPTKVIITLGEKNTNIKFTDKVSGIEMLNASMAIMKETQFHTGMSYKEIFAIVDDGLDAEVFKKKPAMRASVSEATALDGGD